MANGSHEPTLAQRDTPQRGTWKRATLLAGAHAGRTPRVMAFSQRMQTQL